MKFFPVSGKRRLLSFVFVIDTNTNIPYHDADAERKYQPAEYHRCPPLEHSTVLNPTYAGALQTQQTSL